MAEMDIKCLDCGNEFRWCSMDEKIKYCPYCASSNLEILIDESHGL